MIQALHAVRRPTEAPNHFLPACLHVPRCTRRTSLRSHTCSHRLRGSKTRLCNATRIFSLGVLRTPTFRTCMQRRDDHRSSSTAANPASRLHDVPQRLPGARIFSSSFALPPCHTACVSPLWLLVRTQPPATRFRACMNPRPACVPHPRPTAHSPAVQQPNAHTSTQARASTRAPY